MPARFAVRAVLFDSGGVLIQPIGGRWNPRADFEQVLAERVPTLTPADFRRAIAVGDQFFAAATSTPDYDEYHRVMLGELGVDPTAQLLAELRRPIDPR